MKQILSALLALITTECFMGYALSSIKYSKAQNNSIMHRDRDDRSVRYFSIVIFGIVHQLTSNNG